MSFYILWILSNKFLLIKHKKIDSVNNSKLKFILKNKYQRKKNIDLNKYGLFIIYKNKELKSVPNYYIMVVLQCIENLEK